MSLDLICPAFVANKALNRLPKNASGFKLVNGYPEIQIGEVYCRGPGLGNSLCGRGLSSRKELKRHRRGSTKLRASYGRLRRASIRMLSTSKLRVRRPVSELLHGSTSLIYIAGFYEDMMKDEDIEGLSKAQVDAWQGGAEMWPSRDSALSMTEEQDEDDEEQISNTKIISKRKGSAVSPAAKEVEDVDDTVERYNHLNHSPFDSQSLATASDSYRTFREQRNSAEVSGKRETEEASHLPVIEIDTDESPSGGQCEQPKRQFEDMTCEIEPMDEEEEYILLDAEKAEAHERLEKAVLRKIEMKQKLASIRKRRAASGAR